MRCRMSVRETTPVNLPPILRRPRFPGGEQVPGWGWTAAVEEVVAGTAAGMVGVGGALDAGLGVSTIHILPKELVQQEQ
jgi:hypothetical protein